LAERNRARRGVLANFVARRALLVLGLLALAATGAGARDVPGVPPIVTVPVPVPSPVVTGCWLDVRLFRTLRLGNVDYCRESMRYQPGALDCYQFTDQVCSVFYPGSGVVETRSPVHSQIFRCPEGPEPPLCRKLDFR
jgi:hypothetical protein